MKFKNIFIFAVLMLSTTASTAQKTQPSKCGPILLGQPLMAEVITGLNLLSPSETEHFYVTEWGDASQLEDPAYEYEKMVAESINQPQPFYNKENNRRGGIAAFNYNIYAEGYYRMVAGPKLFEKIKNQPWLEWDATTRKYKLRYGSTAAGLLRNYLKDGKVKVYRGVDQAGLDFIKRILSGDRSELSGDSFGYSDALFFTPDHVRARGTWASKAVIELELPENILPHIYAGIEFDYVEVALTPEALLSSIETAIIHLK